MQKERNIDEPLSFFLQFFYAIVTLIDMTFSSGVGPALLVCF